MNALRIILEILSGHTWRHRRFLKSLKRNKHLRRDCEEAYGRSFIHDVFDPMVNGLPPKKGYSRLFAYIMIDSADSTNLFGKLFPTF